MFAAAIEAMPDAVLIVSGDGSGRAAGLTLVASNAAARELLRLGEAAGARLVSVLRHPEILEAAIDTLARGEPHSLSYEEGGAQASCWRAWTRPLPGHDAGHIVVVLRDETGARRHDRMRADFFANASHELRTPLASLAGFIETLRGHARDDPAARERFLAIMAGQAERMGRLIDDLLSLSRIELVEHRAPDGSCDVALKAGEVADALAPVLARKQITLALDLPAPGEALAVGDGDQIGQVVQNLVANAVKYSPPQSCVRLGVTTGEEFEALDRRSQTAALRAAGGGRLALIAPDRAHEHRYVVLTVGDQGVGMGREHLPRLAERFYRVPGQKSGDVPGTGLGLAIVKHIVNRHRGALVVQSAPGAGACFTVYLPAVAATPRAAHPVAAVAKTS
ncbi:MAG TPA: ATP-binding protein [Caulobacteraceae bacterium]|nr:ATP-binding protein [Caulobacteraceae bacterium]